ncbi:hypothetical protein Y032_0092g2553 [Ancylostoma ceylanicum]|uniref:Reverse transcriptase domain-containing protein n=1 Tax=Ancylostoma ceylanicum TaxID=53326 RepID=A0A016TLV1_9BILA|nr:hypothetical protein Y032_0092g2553 [Ancylostoma ceylanicum]
MPVNIRSRQNKSKTNRTPSPIPVLDEPNSTPGKSLHVSPLDDVATHINTISSFLENAPNVPRNVIDSFRALQSAISVSHKSCEDYFHQRSIVIHGIPELPTNALPSERQADVEARVSDVFDALGVEARPWAVFRMGKMSETRPRLTKVILHSRSQFFPILGRARSLRQMSDYKHIFIRASITEAERRREYDLRKEVRDRNQLLGHKKFVVYRAILVYRPPSCSITDDQKLIDTLDNLCANSKNILLLGDFNLAIDSKTNSSSCPRACRYIELFEDLLLKQHVHYPTRGSNTLDLILANEPIIRNIKLLPPLCGSDHAILSFDLLIPTACPQFESYPDFNHGNFDAISLELSTVDWWHVLDNSSSMNELYHRFLSILHNLFSRFIPQKQRKISWNVYPRHILNLMEQRNRLFSQLDDPLTSDQYRNISEELEKHIKKFRAFKGKKLSRMSSQSLFAYMRPLLNEQNASQTIYDDEGTKYRTDQEKAEVLAHYFASTFQTANDHVPPSFDATTQSCCSSTPVISPYEVLLLLRKLKPTTSCSSDGIPQVVFKRCADQLAIPVSIIVNLSLRTGILPDIWKHGIVVPIPKKCNASHVSDFRPISINAVICKIAEEFVRRKLLNFCLREHILPAEQYGFLQGSSTTLQLVACDHFSKKALIQGKSTDILYFDLSKAFDRLNVSKLVLKLYDIGIQGFMLKWIISYLTNRTFAVRFGSATSLAQTATSGVPQGGVLSPLLFMLYTRELPSLLAVDSRIQVAAYADDIKVYGSYSEKDRSEVTNALQISLENILSWAASNDINVNLSKSSCITISNKLLDISTSVLYSHSDASLPRPAILRDLGVLLNSKLSPRDHVDALKRAALQKIHLLFRNVRYADKTVYIKLYKAYILPQLEYASQVWSPFLRKDIRIVEKAQMTFTRILFYRLFPNSNYPQDLPCYMSRLQQLNLKSLFYRRVFADLVLAFRILRLETKLVPSEFWVWKPCSGRTGAFSFHYFPLTASRSHNRIFDESFFVGTSKWLQKLPDSLLSSPDSSSFKQKLKLQDLLSLLDMEDLGCT